MKGRINQIKDTLTRHKILVSNFGYLSILQAYSVLLPLLTIPYLMRVLGYDTYGLVIYAQAIIQYFVIIVNFGFNISATKDISIHRNDKVQLKKIVSSVLTVKVALFMLSFAVLCICIFFIPAFREHYILYLFSMALCLSEVVLPIWYFQGIEKMRYITIVNVISRTLFAACIFLLIKQPEHYLWVPLFNGLGALIGGFFALWIVFVKEKVGFSFQPWHTLLYFIKDSAPLFLTRAAAQIYVRTNIVVVGTFLGMAEAGFYDVALKVLTVLGMPFQTLKQVIFPKVSKDLDISFVHKAIKMVIVLAIIIIVVMQMLAPFVMLTITGIESETAVQTLRLLLLVLLAMVMSGFFGEQLLIPFGKKKPYVRGMVSTAFFYFIVLSLLYLFNLLNLYSIVLLVVGTEFFLALYFLISCKKFKLI